MAQRSIRTPRFPFATQGSAYRAVPVARHVVMPGETLKRLRFMAKLQSLPVFPPLAGAYFDVWFFYVPMQACWNGWRDWIKWHEGLGAQPALPTGVPAPSHFETQATGMGAMYLRAYWQVINRYFRTQVDTQPAIPPVDVNGIAELAAMPNCDLGVEGMFTRAGFDIDETVTVTSNEFSVREFREASALMSYNQRVADLDGEYNNFLRQYGVNANAIREPVPEPIGHYRKFIMPSRAMSDSTGFTANAFYHECDMNLTKPRFFPEHGFIVGIASLRNKVYHTSGTLSFESLWNTPAEWPFPGKPDILDQQYQNWGGVTVTGDQEYTSDAYLAFGQQLNGRSAFNVTETVPVANASFVVEQGSADPTGWRFPNPEFQSQRMFHWATAPDSDYDLGGRDFQIEGVTSMSIATPLRLQVPDHQSEIGDLTSGPESPAAGGE